MAPFQEAAQAAATQAGTAMQEGAKEAAKKVDYQSLPKVKLDVDLKAPVIVIPQNSKSEEALLVDLGEAFG